MTDESNDPFIRERTAELRFSELPTSKLTTTSRPQQYPYDTRRHKVGQRSRDHCTDAQSGEIVTTVGRQRAQSADLDANRAEVCEAA